MPSGTCYACKENLLLGARRCSKCHAWQGWRRYLGELTLISLFSVLASAAAVGTVFFQFIKLNDRLESLERNFKYNIVYEQWKKENGEFIEDNGIPTDAMMPISKLWYQFFERGYVLYNASSNWSVILDSINEEFNIYDNPEALISLYDPQNIDTELLRTLHAGPRYKQYYQLFQRAKITGGIGTLYVEHDLAPKIGNPISKEMSINDAAYKRGRVYDLLIGAINRQGDTPSSTIRAVFALFHKASTYKRFVIDTQ